MKKAISNTGSVPPIAFDAGVGAGEQRVGEEAEENALDHGRMGIR